MRIVRVNLRGWVDVSVWDDSRSPHMTEGVAEESIANELHSWLASLHNSTGPVGGHDDVSVDDWSFAEGIEARVWEGSDA